jgi:hypothetical protein
MPAGAGHKPWRTGNEDFLEPPADPVLAGDDGALDFD